MPRGRPGHGRQSPALGLGHELDHAAAGDDAFGLLAEIPDRRFDNLEERRVILGSERHAARTLHESVRYDHRGRIYRVDSPVARYKRKSLPALRGGAAPVRGVRCVVPLASRSGAA